MRLGVAVSPARQAGIPAVARLSASKFVTISEEEMTLTAASRSAMLDELADVVTHFSLHTADPGQTGASEVSGGSYGRVSAVWGAATDFQVSASPAVFTIPAGTPSFVGFWSASSGGTFYGSAALASPSLQSAGSFTVPVIRVYLDAGDVAIATGVSSDELRLLLHDGGLLQAPPHVDPDTWAYPAWGTYDDEQGGWPMRLPVTSVSKALAVTLGTNKSAMWFGTLPDGTEVLWLDCASAVANVSATVPSFASPTTWTVEWSGIAADNGHIWQSGAAGTPRGYLFTGDIAFWDGAAGDVSASTIETLIGINPHREVFEARWVAVGTSLDVDVRVPGGSWVSAISSATIAAVSLPGVIRLGRSASGASQGQHLHLRVRSGGVGSPIVANFVPTLFPAGNRTNAATAVDEHGVTWTLTKPTAASTDEPKVALPGERRFVMPGVTGENLSVARGAGVTTTEIVYVDSAGAETTATTTADPVVADAAGEWVEIRLRDGVGGAVYDVIDSADADADAYTFVSSTSGATVTVNHSTAAGYKVLLVEEGQTVVQGDGVNDQLVIVGDLSVMDFDPAVGLSLVARLRIHNTTANSGQVLTATLSNQDGALIQRSSTSARLLGRLDDGSAVIGVGDSADHLTYGQSFIAVAAFGSSDHEYYADGVSIETVSTAVAAEPAATLPTFFRRADGGLPFAFDLLDFWIVRRRLSDSSAATATTEMGF